MHPACLTDWGCHPESFPATFQLPGTQAGQPRLPPVTVVLPVRGCRPHSLANWQATLGLNYGAWLLLLRGSRVAWGWHMQLGVGRRQGGAGGALCGASTPARHQMWRQRRVGSVEGGLAARAPQPLPPSCCCSIIVQAEPWSFCLCFRIKGTPHMQPSASWRGSRRSRAAAAAPCACTAPGPRSAPARRFTSQWRGVQGAAGRGYMRLGVLQAAWKCVHGAHGTAALSSSYSPAPLARPPAPPRLLAQPAGGRAGCLTPGRVSAVPRR